MFLKASTSEQYLLRLAVRLAASYYSKQPVSLAEVAQQERLSLKYLEELVRVLKRHRLVKAVRGRRGGYIFVRNPRRVSVKDIIWLISRERFLTFCLDPTRRKDCLLASQCRVRSVWRRLQQTAEAELKKITLDQLI